MITFVTYFVHFSDEIIHRIGDVYEDIAIEKTYLPIKYPSKVVTMMFESVLKCHKDARMVLITDETTKIDLPDFIEIHRIPRKTDMMEIESLEAKIWALKNLKQEGHLIFLDPDMIVRYNLEHIFESEGDLFFTYEKLSRHQDLINAGKELQQPINIGFIAVRDSKREDVAHLFGEFIEQFSLFDKKKYLYWIGLQYLLRELFYPKLIENENAGTLDTLFFLRRWVKIVFLEAEKYNFTVRESAKIPGTAKVLHFKGIQGKRLMEVYWKTYIPK